MNALGSQLLTPVLRVVLPHHCEVCGRGCDGWICPECEAEFEGACGGAMCDVCGYPLVGEGDPCPRCLHRRGRLVGRILRLALHEGVAKELVHRLKYAKRWSVARGLAQAMLGRPEIAELLAEGEVLVPIPLHFRRYWTRGFNQSEVLARELAGNRKLRVIRALRRTRSTAAQSTLHSLAARARNMHGAFSTKRVSGIAGKHVILIDDVATTGATLRAAARALWDLGPASVDALVITIADPR